MAKAKVETADSAKRSVAGFTALATIGAAVISAAVSYYVSGKTVAVEMQRATTEDAVKRATVFSELMRKAATEDNAGYAILALWKLYQHDRKLVVITALQSEDPRAIAVLELLELENELKPYKDTVLGVLRKSEAERRPALLRLYAQIDPKGVVEEAVDKILEQRRDTFIPTDEFQELVALLKEDHDLVSHLRGIIASDSRVGDSVTNRFVLALALYLADNADPFYALLSEYDGRIEDFGHVASLLTAGGDHFTYAARDYERFVELATRFMSATSTGAVESNQFLFGLELAEMAFLQGRPITDSERKNLVAALEAYFVKFPERRFERERTLKFISSMDRERARELFHFSVFCEPEAQARQFYLTTSVISELFDGDQHQDFDEAREVSSRELALRELSCASWRA